MYSGRSSLAPSTPTRCVRPTQSFKKVDAIMGPSLEIKSLLLKLKKQVPRVCVTRALLNKVVAAIKNPIDWLNPKPTVFITSFQRGSNKYGSWSRYILCNNHIPVRTVATSLHVLSEAAARSSALLLLSLPSLIGSNTFAEKVTAAEHSHASRTQKGVLTQPRRFNTREPAASLPTPSGCQLPPAAEQQQGGHQWASAAQ